MLNERLSDPFMPLLGQGLSIHRASSSDDAVSLELSQPVQQLVSHADLSHPIVVSKVGWSTTALARSLALGKARGDKEHRDAMVMQEWTLTSVNVSTQPLLTATMAASASAPDWLSLSPVIACLAWQQQLLLISKVRAS